MRRLILDALALPIFAALLCSCANEPLTARTSSPPPSTLTLPAIAAATPLTSAECPNRDPSDPPWVCRKGPATAASTPTSRQDQVVLERCAELGDSLPPYAGGSIALWSDPGLVLVDVQSGKNVATLVEGGRRFHIYGKYPLTSPDGQYLAFAEAPIPLGTGDRGQLRVVDTSGNEVARTPFEQPWDLVTGWLGNDLVEIAVSIDPPGTVATYNPFLSSINEITPAFPDIAEDPTSNEWYLRAPVALYDPSLARVAYYAYDPDGALGSYWLYRLWDVDQQRELARVPDLYSLSPPAWSPDGSAVAFNALVARGGDTATIVVLSRDGELLATVDLSSAACFHSTCSGVTWPSWSPSKRLIAAWILKEESAVGLPTVGVFDLDAMTLTDYCVEGYPDHIPIWSPDGRYIASNAAIVDTVESKVYHFRPGTPIGWLAPGK